MAAQSERLGSYELTERLGAGGMAETFLAIRRGLGGFEQRVCVKRILPAFETDQDFVRLFLGEANLSARLRHANIAQVIDFGIVDGSHFLALELVDGADLRAVLRYLSDQDERMQPEMVAHLAVELASGLDHAHQHAQGPGGTRGGVVHRDVSPSNVLLSHAGEVKLTDFGIAKAMNQPGVTRSGVVKGKVPYMAPEYARHGRFDARSDLFAVGVTLFECLAGRRPFDGVTELDTLERITNGQREALSDAAPQTPAPLVEAVERLLEPDPDARFQSAAELLDALGDVAPPPRIRRTLGALIKQVAAAQAAANESGQRARPAGTESLAGLSLAGHELDETIMATPSGTMMHTGARERSGDSQRPVIAATPDAATRTRLPDVQEVDALSSPATVNVAPDPGQGAHQGGALHAVPGTGAERRRFNKWLAIAALLVGVAGGALVWMQQSSGANVLQSDALRSGDALRSSDALRPTAGELGVGDKPVAERRDEVPAQSSATADSTRRAEPAQGETGTRVSAAASAPQPTEHVDGTGSSNSASKTSESEPSSPRSRRTRQRRARTAAATQSSARGKATLSVVVVPYGSVWINGTAAGQSPVRKRLEAGEHVVEAAVGTGSRRKRKRISLKNGESKSLRFP